MTRKKTGLGRGLDALIPGSTSEQNIENSIVLISTERIDPNPRQPRTNFKPDELSELAQSIKEHGVIQPLIVTKGQMPGHYILIAGERRLHASKIAGLREVPVIVRSASDQQRLEIALIENVQRTDLGPLEAAEAYRQLSTDFNLSHQEIADRVGKSRAAITNTLRLLNLPPGVKETLKNEMISEGHARVLLGLPTSQAQTAALTTIIQNHLSVRQTEELVRKLSGERPARKEKQVISPEIKELEERMRAELGTKVKLRQGRNGGTITIHYYSDEELESLIDRFIKIE